MKAVAPVTEFTLWRSEQLFGIDFASYALAHHSFSRHFHDHYVIELVVKGADRFYCNNEIYTATGNQLVFLNPGEVHTGSTIGDTQLQYFSLCPDKIALQETASALHIPLPAGFIFRQSLADRPLLAEKFLRLFRSFHQPALLLRQEEFFFDCMNELLQPSSSHTGADTRKHDLRVSLVKEFIHAHFTEEISLCQLTGLVQINPFHLSRVFKKVTGISPYEYLMATRVEYARQLLRKGHKVQDAALGAGFYDASHFNRLFRKVTAASPKAFRSSKCQDRTIFPA